MEFKVPTFSYCYLIGQWCQFSSTSVEFLGVSKPSNSRSSQSSDKTTVVLSNTVILSGTQKDRFLVEVFVDNQTDPIEDSE